MAEVLVVDDEPGIRRFLSEVVADLGHAVTAASDGVEALQLLRSRAFDLLITDLKMPNLDGMSLLRHAREHAPDMEALVLTAHGTVDDAVEAMRLGAFDFLTKPLSGPEQLELLVDRALERRSLLTRQLAHDEPAAGFVATSAAMTPVVATLRKVAPTNATVLLVGESGTGKEVAARALHRWSKRQQGPFVAVNCATMTEQLLASELFGHEKGAFTGASERRRGRIEQAQGGTLFLDEIGELRPDLQARLLRVLQERTFERLGGSVTLAADVRWIAATNRDLAAEMQTGGFREDLYHRLAVFPVQLPPLRERMDDLPALAEHLLQRATAELGRPPLSLSPAAAARLRAYAWPGNIRELSNALERAAILADGDAVTPDDLVLGLPGGAPTDDAVTLVEAERQAIQRALAAEDGNRKRTAERLGISLRSLYDKLKTHGLN